MCAAAAAAGEDAGAGLAPIPDSYSCSSAASCAPAASAQSRRSSGDLLSVPVVDEADTLGPKTLSDVADQLWTAVAEREEAEEQADRDDEDR